MGKCVDIGGQAVIEGVMMRAPESLVIAVRREDKKIVVKKDKIKIDNNKLFKKPFLRGLIGLYNALILGVKALNFSAYHAMGEGCEKVTKKEIFVAMVMGLGLGALLFVFLPLFLTEMLKHIVPAVKDSFLVFNAVDGAIRVIFFIAYIYLISFMKDIKRVFEYHGAEHKAIFTYESGLPLTVENARGMSRLHPRCGTSFLLIVMIVSIFVFSLIPKDSHFLIKLSSRLILLPVIAGISYEVLKLSSKYKDNFIVNMLIKPGLWLQKITTREPDDSQLEVALISIKEALGENNDSEELIYV
ncbi:MAG: DUF1385 domain-containing protein [Deferribacterales bacterium]|jgi:uncharacterized protein YqhQ|uniref:DUF1385 domain-containing protein n=1 Tax=Deferrivibrio essentukiensis TaxID=2880922 RepID=UPI0019AEA11D|nr:DUF1385 domain-containing protein [Deferrivibrio essentukiensis]MBC7196162.1 DUF1385 domain-containing protein [Deferribacterales bacterium]MCB4203736.1 DUF1385 domain-containing protein [Deferrivibrio essentukiensis]